MRLVINPISNILEKGRALPDGARRQYGNIWFKKVGGDWVYDGMAVSKRKGSGPGVKSKKAKPKTSPPAQAPTTSDVTKISSGEFSKAKDEHTKRDRMGEGQEVTYRGTYWKHRVGAKGKVVAIGKNGFAMVKFHSDGKTETATWKDIVPDGQIKPHSVYDKIDEKNVYKLSGEMNKKLLEIVGQKIGNSHWSYLDLCKEFRRRGFNLQIVGGTVRDIISGKKEVKDIDFIFNGTDRELEKIIGNINRGWLSNATRNKHLGLFSINDAGDVVDITPLHKFSPEMNDMAKGWNLHDDAHARDFTINSLQIDPTTGILVDATGRGLEDIKNQVLNFTNVSLLKTAPRYVLRAFKFLGRGYKVSPESEKAIKDNIKYVTLISPPRKETFIRRQIGEKDGLDGLNKFKAEFKKYNEKIWDSQLEAPWRKVYKQFGGK